MDATKKLPYELITQADRPHEISKPFSVMAVTSIIIALHLQVTRGVRRMTEFSRKT